MKKKEVNYKKAQMLFHVKQLFSLTINHEFRGTIQIKDNSSCLKDILKDLYIYFLINFKSKV